MARAAVEIAENNLKNSGLHKLVEVKHQSIFDYFPPEGPGVVVTNPPYGERLKKDQITTFYKQLGDTFKQRYDGYKVWVLSGNAEALKNFGLRAQNPLTLYNGPIECRYHQYDIYSGSKKAKNQDFQIKLRK